MIRPARSIKLEQLPVYVGQRRVSGGFREGELPALGVGSSAGILVYVSGTSNGMSVSERAAGIQGVWVHPFAR